MAGIGRRMARDVIERSPGDSSNSPGETCNALEITRKFFQT